MKSLPDMDYLNLNQTIVMLPTASMMSRPLTVCSLLYLAAIACSSLSVLSCTFIYICCITES